MPIGHPYTGIHPSAASISREFLESYAQYGTEAPVFKALLYPGYYTKPATNHVSDG